MSIHVSKLRQLAFTLIELLIVVIILAILAAIVIPQFTSSTTDAQESALDADLATMRSAIELYKVQHTNGIYPGSVATSGATCPSGGTAGTGAAYTEQAFDDSMLMASNAAGQTCSVGDPVTFKYGPYIRKAVPTDPIYQLSAVSVTSAVAAITPSAATGGWAYSTSTGQFVMNSNANDSKSQPYYTH